jgi:hypothetical protein
VRHRVGEWSLKKVGWRRPVERVTALEVRSHRLHPGVKPANLTGEIGLGLGPVPSAHEERPRIAEYARHVPYELRRRAAGVAGAELPKAGGRVAQRLLGSIGESGEEMSKQGALVRVTIVTGHRESHAH